jgi:hypothetical protein
VRTTPVTISYKDLVSKIFYSSDPCCFVWLIYIYIYIYILVIIFFFFFFSLLVFLPSDFFRQCSVVERVENSITHLL